MARLPTPTRESVPEDQREVFDELMKVVDSVPLIGPGSVLMHVPTIRLWQKRLNDYLRHESSLPKKILELAILVTARELDCQHIWNWHAALARKAGVHDAIVENLRDRKALPSLARDEAAVVFYGQEFFRTHHVSRGTFQMALEEFGRRGVVELASLLGMYSLLSLIINSFDTELPPNRTELLLPV